MSCSAYPYPDHRTPFRVPALLGVLALTALVWCFAQAIVPVPYSLAHPGWEIADAALGAQTDAFIALDRSRAIDQALQLYIHLLGDALNVIVEPPC